MPWKECHVMDERMRFVARLLDGEKMAGLCEEFGISRKTGYKIYDRYKEVGLHGLTDRSRRPHRHANQLPTAVEKLIVEGRVSVNGTTVLELGTKAAATDDIRVDGRRLRAAERKRYILLYKPAGVVTTRNHVHYVVTEHGIASLYGKTIA